MNDQPMKDVPGVRLPDGRILGLRSGQGGVNPKDRIGATKVDMTVLPPIGTIETAFAMMDGDRKYGAFNWRVEPVLARTYVGAAMRHLNDWLDGEERAPDSMAHHLAHAAACCFILMDAQANSTLEDDRPIQTEGGEIAARAYDRLNHLLKMMSAEKVTNTHGGPDV